MRADMSRGIAVRIAVKVKVRAHKTRIVQAEGLNVEAALAAPPVDGAANSELLELLASSLSLPKSALRLVVGQASKHKVVEVSGLQPADVASRLARAAP